jgi:hypothetical protein
MTAARSRPFGGAVVTVPAPAVAAAVPPRLPSGPVPAPGEAVEERAVPSSFSAALDAPRGQSQETNMADPSDAGQRGLAPTPCSETDLGASG